MPSPSSTSAAAPKWLFAVRLVLLRVLDVADVVARLLSIGKRGMFRLYARQNAPPVFDGFRRLTVDFEPDEGLAEAAAVRQRSLHSRMCTEVAKTALKHERLTKAFDVAPGERQFAEFECRRFLLVAVLAVRRSLTTKRQSERYEERSEKNRVRQSFWRRLEVSAVRIQFRERLPELRSSPVMELR